MKNRLLLPKSRKNLIPRNMAQFRDAHSAETTNADADSALRAVSVVINERSGRSLDDGCGDIRRELERQLSGRIHSLQFVQPDQLAEAITQAFDDPDSSSVVVGGGDGTVTLAATHAARTQKPFLPLPFGTENWFPNDVGLTPDAPIADYINQPFALRHLDLAWCEDKPFLLCAIIGKLPAAFSYREAVRGQMRYYHRILMWLKSCYRFFAYHAEPLTLHCDDQTHHVRAKSVIITNNAFDNVLTRRPTRTRMDEGRLYVHVLAQHGLLDLFQFIRKVAKTDWKAEAGFERFAATEVRLEWKRPRQRLVMVDGEFYRMHANLRYTIEPATLPVLVPKSG